MDAQSIMTTNVVGVGPDARVEVIATMLLDRRISAVPVVDEEGVVLGIVSEGDLMRRPEAETEPRHSWWLTAFQTPLDHATEYLKTHGLSAADVMTREVVTVSPETPVSEIAETLERRHIKRVPVVRDGKLVGIVSRADLLHALATHKNTPPSAAWASDQSIRDEILRRLAKERLPGGYTINPVVSDGVVKLWGLVDSQEERKAVQLVASAVDGVKSVDNNIGILEGTARQAMWAE